MKLVLLYTKRACTLLKMKPNSSACLTESKPGLYSAVSEGAKQLIVVVFRILQTWKWERETEINMLYFHHQFLRVIVIHCFISLQFFPINIPLIPSVFKCFTELKRLQMHFLLLDNNGAGEQRKDYLLNSKIRNKLREKTLKV